MKKVLYENKCTLNFKHVEDVLKMDISELVGRRILAVQQNGFVVAGKIINHPEYVIFYNYTDDKLSSLEYLLNTPSEEIDDNLYDQYPEFKKTIASNTSEYDAIKCLNYGFIYVLFLDEYEITIDADDKPFEKNVLNLLSFDPEIDYYSQGMTLSVFEDTKESEIVTLQHHPKSTFSDGHFIELATYEFFDSVKYLNYLFNFKLMVDNVEFEL